MERCAACRAAAGRLDRLRRLVREGAGAPEEPDWSGFWPGIAARLGAASPRPLRDPWWLPLWRPVWGHPRLSAATAAAAGIVLTFSLWSGREGERPLALASPIVVQDAGASDPGDSVMVYAGRDDVTVVWVFPAAARD